MSALATAPRALGRLRVALGEVADLERAAAVLSWDQETYMPEGGVEDRASQLATLRRLAHERLTSAAVGRLLERAEREVEDLPYDSDEASLVRVTRRDFERSARVPAALVAERARVAAQAWPLWREAKARSDWSLFEPAMRVNVDLSRRLAEAIGYERRPMDALLQLREPGLTTDRVAAIFADLKPVIAPLLGRLRDSTEQVDDSVLDRPCDEERQLRFALEVIAALGYDLTRGRQDLSAHPFCTSFGPGDVRVTTRTGPTFRESCLLSSVHEAGHGMYSQGVPRSLDRTPLWGGASAGVHESQSRLWENLVARSRPFWEWCFPRLRETFPDELDGVGAEPFWRAVNRVRASYIRVDSDEVTYNLHILLRFEIEEELLSGALDVSGIPEAWNERVREYLGLDPPPASRGPLQDIHWCNGLGGFVGYTLGNLIAAQLMETARRELPGLDGQLARGRFAPLLGWLRDRVHRHGRKFTPDELVERTTGQPVSAGPWIEYIRTKFASGL